MLYAEADRVFLLHDVTVVALVCVKNYLAHNKL